MKKYILSIWITSLTCIACEKLPQDLELQRGETLQYDSDGGEWKTILLPAATHFPVITPVPEASEAGLETVRKIQQRIEIKERENFEYWNTGSVFRWQEIARALAAQYNIPPEANTDGTYPVPNASNPCVYPRFPFANPPYAARMFAYLSVAQYDALVAAWHHAYAISQKPAYERDPSIKALTPGNESFPAYPSVEAVVGSASLEVLRIMFPCEVDNLNAKFAAQQQALLLSGRYVQLDLDAGIALGKQVAQLVLSRSKTDGMSKANDQSLVAGFIAGAKSMGINKVWESQESPLRPPLLPGFGNIQPWNLTRAQLVEIRPPAPPVLGGSEFQKNVEELLDIAQNLSREKQKIANYWADGPGSYTPPGHWNRTASTLCLEYGLNELRTARVMALVSTAVADAGVACWDAKYHYYYPRPFQMDSKIRTTVGLPNFPSYSSGHSSFSGAAAVVLSYLFPAKADQLFKQAEEASLSRIYGGIHYRFDCEAGLKNGMQIGAFAIQRGKNDGSPQ